MSSPKTSDCIITSLSARDYFAAFAMQGILASTNSTGTAPWPDPLWLAEKSYQYADAMIKEGQKS
jgi:hypothetical protein